MGQSRPPTFDLQSHSTFSDGALPPAEVVALAAASGVTLLALSDHDSVDGVSEALAQARALGMRLSPAAEISAVHGGYEDLHILGYEVDCGNEEFRRALASFRADRVDRSTAIVGRLRELGFVVPEEEIQARAKSGKAIGRPHIAQAALTAPENTKLLAHGGIAGMDEFFVKYLVPGALAYLPRTRPTVSEAIQLIHRSGGVAVWAHPFWDCSDADEVLGTLAQFQAEGLDGVEVFYHSHTKEQTELLHAVCVKQNLLITGSSDFHGPKHQHMNTFRAFDLYGLQPNLGPIGLNP